MIRKSTWWLMGTALVAVVYTMVFEVDRKPPPVAMPEFLPGFNAREVNSVQIEFKGTNILKIVREENRWTLQHPIRYPGMGEGPELLLSVLERLRPAGYVDLGKTGNNPDYASYGLDPPRAVLRFDLTEDRPALELHLGSLTPLEDMVYARTPNQPGLFILPKDFQRAVPMSANFWRDPNLIHLGGNQLEADTISIRSGPRLMTLQHNRTNGTWQVTQPAPIKRGDKARIEQMLVNVWNWQVFGFVSDDPKIDLEQFGLHSPVAELTLGRGTNRLAAVQFGISPPGQSDFVFARILNHTNVVIVTKPGLDELRAPVWDFCDHRIADPIGPSKLARIEVQAGENFVLTQSTNSVWRLTAPSSLPADEALVMDLLRNLQLMEALELKRELVADFSQFGLAKPSASYTLRTRGGTNRIHTQITFGNSASDASDRLYARRGDKDSVYVVANATRQLLPSYSYELRDRKIWNFLPNEVTKITIEDGAKATILQRNNTGQWTRPGQQLAANEMRDLKTSLSFLGQFKVVDWTTRGADKLAGFEILSRKKSLTLELLRDGQTLTRKIQFGRKSPQQNIYAFATDPLEQEPVVFEFPANTFGLCEIGLFPLAMQPPEK